MDLVDIVNPGMTEETIFIVEDQHTAAQIGSGSLRVLATPIMIAMIEKTCHQLLARKLPDGSSSVGIQVNVRHLAPTPLGGKVKVVSEVILVEGKLVTFAVQAWDDVEKIGDGQHQRMVIDIARFLKRVSAKQAALG